MGATLSTIAYLVAAVLFILTLRGLSHPETSRQGNLYGMIGMAIAVVATLLRPGVDVGGIGLILLGLAIGGGVGAFIATRIQMTALPQLVAAFHSLVGMAAVFVAAAAFYAPESFGIGTRGDIHGGSLVEMSLGLAIGAVTFSGSVIAFAKLQALMSGAPITFPCQHWLNLGLGILMVVLVVAFVVQRRGQPVLADRADRVRARLPAHHPDRRRRHAGRGLHAEQLLRLGGGGHRLHPRQPAADRHRRAGRRVGRDPLLHHVQGDEPLHHQRAARRLRHGQLGGRGGRRRRRRQGPGEGRQPGGRRLHHEERREDHRRARLRHGGGAGAAGAARDGRPPEEGGGARWNTPSTPSPAGCPAT